LKLMMDHVYIGTNKIILFIFRRTAVVFMNVTTTQKTMTARRW